jgi:hypothetical protein
MFIRPLRFGDRRWLETGLAIAIVLLAWQLYVTVASRSEGSLRLEDFPQTYVGRIHLDLTSPNHSVTLTWVGPNAAPQQRGPFHSSPGAGWGTNDCNDPIESNCFNSRCTPKGLRKVEALRDSIVSNPQLRYFTVIDGIRAIGFHSHPSVPDYPASQGCIRLEPYAAQLIFENAIVGVTEVLVDGTWTNPNNQSKQ